MRGAWDAVPRRRWPAALIVLLVGALGGLLPGWVTGDAPWTVDAARGMPEFEDVPCWSPGAAAVPVRCGYLTVPESRQRPNGRFIRVAVAILSPEGVPPATMPAPLVHLAGGPGAPAGLSGPVFETWLDWYAHWAGGRRRALILVDQRGTGESEPRLYCDPEVFERMMRAYFGAAVPRDPVEHAAWWRDFLMECRAPFDDAGVDVTAYNTAENAADLVDLRRALGIAQWDVWGVSYGTELALELLRIDEAGTRTLILDSVSLYNHPEVVVGNVAAAFDRALIQVVRDCLLDEGCKTAFPLLSSGLSHGLTRLNLRPERLTLSGSNEWDGARFVLDGGRAVELLLEAMYFSDFVPVVPATIFSFGLGNPEPVHRLANFMIAEGAMLPMAELMHVSTNCRAAPRGEALRRLADQEGRYPGYAVLWAAAFHQTVCAAWNVPAAEPEELLPVHSDVPALILGGRYDPITPPEWGRIVAEWLPNSTVIEFPHLAHGSVSLDYCADRIAATFLDWPDGNPQHPCATDLGPPQFLLPGNGKPLELADP